MSATVRISSRIQARKNRLVSTETEPAAGGRKRKNSKDDQTPAIPPTTPAKKSAVSQSAVSQSDASPSITNATAVPTTQTKAPSTSSKASNIVTLSSPANTQLSATVSTRSSQRGSSLVSKEDVKSVPSTPAVRQPVAVPAPTGDAPTATAPGGPVKTEPAPQGTNGGSTAQQEVQVLPPTHIFKNPNFTFSGKGGLSAGKKTRTWKTLKQIIASERVQLNRPVGSTYSSIDAPPSRKPPKKYSDISGLPAKYTDPRTKLRYSNTEEFAQLRMLPQDIVNGLLALRRANLDVQ
ncbi:mucin-2-like [Lytechinus pictus]|uniref:mucin-2-like n=1 Tax=Lytechinus pictus TaxID=7653 RepID=UPI0030BA20CE